MSRSDASSSDETPADATPEPDETQPKPAKRFNVVEEIGIRIHFTFPDLLAIEDDEATGTDGS